MLVVNIDLSIAHCDARGLRTRKIELPRPAWQEFSLLVDPQDIRVNSLHHVFYRGVPVVEVPGGLPCLLLDDGTRYAIIDQ